MIDCYGHGGAPGFKGMASEEPEDIDKFLYGDEAEQIQNVSAVEKQELGVNDEMMPDDLPNEEALNEQPKEQHQENEDEEDYDDLEIVLENSTKAVEPARRGIPNIPMMSSSKDEVPLIATAKTGVDLNAPGQLNGEVIYNVELDSLPDKPWRQPGADITDYFNYGFTEQTWREYCAKQKTVRDENGSQKRIAVFDASAVPQIPFPGPIGTGPAIARPPVMPPGMPPFPFPPPGGAFPFPPPPPFLFPGMPAPGQAPVPPSIVMPGAEAEDRDKSREKDPREAAKDRERESSSRRSHSRREERSRSRSRERDPKRRR